MWKSCRAVRHLEIQTIVNRYNFDASIKFTYLDSTTTAWRSYFGRNYYFVVNWKFPKPN